MTGCLRRFGRPTNRKAPFSRTDLLYVLTKTPSPRSHDDLLFLALLFTGFHALMRLGELVFPDKKDLRMQDLPSSHRPHFTDFLFFFLAFAQRRPFFRREHYTHSKINHQ